MARRLLHALGFAFIVRMGSASSQRSLMTFGEGALPLWAFACEADLTRGPDVAFADDIGGWLSRDGGVKNGGASACRATANL